MTRAQESARMRKILYGIWRKGDRDECSVKHVNHGLAAIVTGGTWQDGLDYKRPWPSDEDRPKAWETRIAKGWEKVQNTYDRLGHDEFMAVIDPEAVPIASYVQSYVDRWYAPATA